MSKERSDSNEYDELFKPIPNEVLKHQMMIGRLCAAWAMLDRGLNDCLAEAINCSTSQAVCIANEIDPVASRCRLLRNLIYSIDIQEWWRDCFADVLVHIEQELAPVRNRVIHDNWRFDGDTIKRVDRRVKLQRPQAHQPKQLNFDVEHLMPTAKIDELIGQIGVQIFAVRGALMDLRAIKHHGENGRKSLLWITHKYWKNPEAEPNPAQAPLI